jgi:putative ABC transport system permease protein
MFFNHMIRNSRRSRKENRLYFSSLIVAIVVGYVLLSLGDQDVIFFLRTLESDAVGKLLKFIPVIYFISLFFVFFLVYFSNRYQLQRRSHEFGIYQILGMKHGRLFLILMGETLWSSLIALLFGIPISLFLTELISLATTRLVGFGIIGHQFRISLQGLLGTAVGFMAVQLLAMVLLSVRMSRKEPIELLKGEKETIQKIASNRSGWVRLFLGILFLLVAYGFGIFLFYSLELPALMVILIAGIAGTFLVFSGLATFIGQWIRKRSKRSTGLFAFTGRQVQENVLHQSKFLAIASLLILMAIMGLSYGIAIVIGNGDYAERTVDFSLKGEEHAVKDILDSEEVSPYIQVYYPMDLSNFGSWTFDDEGQIVEVEGAFSWDGLLKEIETLPKSTSRENLYQNLIDNPPFLVSLSSFNALFESMGEQAIVLNPDELAFYASGQFPTNHDELWTVLQSHPEIRLYSKVYTLAPDLYTHNLVADRFISIMYALVVPDDIYHDVVGDEDPYCWNVIIQPDYVEEQGLMQALSHVNDLLANTDLERESYLTGIGRELFYVVGGSYLTLYLGVLFLIIANTVLGLKFLIQQRNTRHRYETLLILGADEEALYSSTRTQIRVYFTLVIGVAVISSIFGIGSMFRSILMAISANDMGELTIISGIAVLVFLLIEFCYIWLIQSESGREIRRLNHINKG